MGGSKAQRLAHQYREVLLKIKRATVSTPYITQLVEEVLANENIPRGKWDWLGADTFPKQDHEVRMRMTGTPQVPRWQIWIVEEQGTGTTMKEES